MMKTALQGPPTPLDFQRMIVWSYHGHACGKIGSASSANCSLGVLRGSEGWRRDANLPGSSPYFVPECVVSDEQHRKNFK